MAYVGNTPSRGQWRKLSDISASFNGVTTTFTTSVPPGTSDYYVTAGTASQLIISVGGVIQEPEVDYTVSTNSITFTTAPATGLSFFGVLCGDALNTTMIADGSVTTQKLAPDLTVDLASGTAGAPSLTFDANTGLFSPAGDIVAISTNGSERLRIDSNGVTTIQNGAVAVIGTLTDAATITPDLAANCNFVVTLGGNRTLANPTNITAGQSGSIFIVQDATGSRTLSWGSYWDFSGGTAPTLSTAANAVDRVDYIVRSTTSIHTVFTANYS